MNDGTATSASATSTLVVSQPTPSIAGTVAASRCRTSATVDALFPPSRHRLPRAAGQRDHHAHRRRRCDRCGRAAVGHRPDQDERRALHAGAATPAALTTVLEALVFTPTAHQVAPGSTVTTNFALALADTGGGSATDSTTSVVATAATDTPTITGTVAGQTDDGPGAGAAVLRRDASATRTIGVTPTVTITLRSGGAATDANGTLSGTGLAETGVGHLHADRHAGDAYERASRPELRADARPGGGRVNPSIRSSTCWPRSARFPRATRHHASTRPTSPCFCPGTLILTDRGDMPVEALGIGDTRGDRMRRAPPDQMGRAPSICRPVPARNPAVAPIRMRAGSLGGGLPGATCWSRPSMRCCWMACWSRRRNW